ncbi:MAG: hypothetical protein QOI20_2034, partial [Acidimicrobiaceae bacterium]|nr:hypothetical protein [Acidimicrobiaceae bacterium]
MTDTAPTPPARRGSAHPPLARRTPYRTEDWFSADELAEARRYAGPLNRLRIVRTILTTTVFAVLIATHAVPNLLDALDVRGWALQLVVAALV